MALHDKKQSSAPRVVPARVGDGGVRRIRCRREGPHQTLARIRHRGLDRGEAVGEAPHQLAQDDSGIPFSFFQDGEWRVWFFGTYTGTLDLFKKYRQPKLGDAFRTSGVPLAFGTGYKWRLGQSNLLLAVKQEPPKAEPVSAPSN